MLYSRQQYLNNVISHEDYYAQLIEAGKSLGFDFVDDPRNNIWVHQAWRAATKKHARNNPPWQLSPVAFDL